MEKKHILMEQEQKRQIEKNMRLPYAKLVESVFRITNVFAGEGFKTAIKRSQIPYCLKNIAERFESKNYSIRLSPSFIDDINTCFSIVYTQLYPRLKLADPKVWEREQERIEKEVHTHVPKDVPVGSALWAATLAYVLDVLSEDDPSFTHAADVIRDECTNINWFVGEKAVKKLKLQTNTGHYFLFDKPAQIFRQLTERVGL